MKKVLVIEDNASKAKHVKRRLENVGITDYRLFDNYATVISIITCSKFDKYFEQLDLIILDMMFYHYPDYLRNDREILSDGGCMVLTHLAKRYQHKEYKKKVGVIVYSSEDDWNKNLKEYLLPSFSEFSSHYNSHSVLIRTTHAMEDEYKTMCQKNQELIDSIDFVLGHAHNEHELAELLKQWAKSNK